MQGILISQLKLADGPANVDVTLILHVFEKRKETAVRTASSSSPQCSPSDQRVASC